MFSKLDFIEGKYEELSTKISDPSVMADQKEWQKLCKEQSDLEIIVTKYNEYKKVMKDTENDKEMLQDKLDKEMKDMVEVPATDHPGGEWAVAIAAAHAAGYARQERVGG